MKLKDYMNETRVKKGLFTNLKNKIKFMGSDLDEDKHYYDETIENGLKARIEIIAYDFGDDYVEFELEDVITGKKEKFETTIKGWYDDYDFTGGWFEYSDEEQGRAFKFIQSQYNKDTKIKLKAGTEYILNDVKKTIGKDKEIIIRKQKFNRNLRLTIFQGYTIDGDEISFNPTNVIK